jgi:hypothetical protein
LIEKKIKKRQFFLLREKQSHNLTCVWEKKTREERRRRTKRTFAAVFCHVWRSEDASAEKTDGGERCVGFDRE